MIGFFTLSIPYKETFYMEKIHLYLLHKFRRNRKRNYQMVNLLIVSKVTNAEQSDHVIVIGYKLCTFFHFIHIIRQLVITS